MSRFIVEPIDLENDGRYVVKDVLNGWFIPMENERQANFVRDRFVEVTAPKSPLTIEDYFKEWEIAIEELAEKEKEQINLKETYAQLEQEILTTVDFKEIYGKNNESIRKNHVKNELKDIVDRQNDLKLRINYLVRRIDFIKNIMRMQGILIDSGVLE